MKRTLITLLSLMALAPLACSHPGSKPQIQNSTSPSAGVGIQPEDTPTPVMAPKGKGKPSGSIDKAVAKKVDETFEHIMVNDEKKAKQSYGRSYRVMPEFMSFAFDLRFKNYDHALGILPKIEWTDEEKGFWEKILKGKGFILTQALCENLPKTQLYAHSSEVSADERQWVQHVGQLMNEKLPPAEAAPSKKTLSLDQEIGKFSCDSESCGPLAKEVQAELFTDAFFDNLHNMQRRDTRFVKANYKNPLKISGYKRYVKIMNILKLYRGIKATDFAKQNHFLRRIKGVARDLRPESVLSRVIADTILDDKKDIEVARQLQNFNQSHPTLSFLNFLEYGLAGCRLTEAPAPQH